MAPKTYILMLLAIVCGLIASYMTSALISQNQDIVVVLAPKKDLPAGTRIKNPDELFLAMEIRRKTAPLEYFPGDADGLQRLRNRTLDRDLNEGEVITRGDLLTADQEQLLLVEGAPDMIEGLQELEERGTVPVGYSKRALAMAVRLDRIEREANVYRWVLGLFLVGAFVLFLNVVRTGQLGQVERYAGLLKWSALVQAAAVAVILAIAVFQPPRRVVNSALDVTLMVLCSVLAVISVLDICFSWLGTRSSSNPAVDS